MGKFDKDEDELDETQTQHGDISRSSAEKRVIGKAGVDRREQLEKDDDDSFKLQPDEFASFDERFAEGVPKTRVEGFSDSVDTKRITREDFERDPRRRTEDDIDKFGSVAVQDDRDISFDEIGKSALSDKLEDRRVRRTLMKERGTPEDFGEMFTRKFGAKFLDKAPAGKEQKVSGFSQGVISRDNAKKFAKDGFRGNIFSPTQFTVGEKGKKEFVSVKPMNDFNFFGSPKKSKKGKKNNNIFDVGGF